MEELKPIYQLGARVAQIYTSPPRQFINTKVSDQLAEKVVKLCKDNQIELWVHATYLTNLCRPADRGLANFSIDLQNVEAFQAGGLVCHVGKNVPNLNMTKGQATKKMVQNIVKVIEDSNTNSRFVLETAAGQGNEVSVDTDTLELVTRKVFEYGAKNCQFGICIDTCHVYNSGVVDLGLPENIDEYLNRLESVDILDKVVLSHFNNSKNPFGSRLDRHAVVCCGCIDNRGMRYWATECDRLDIPMVMETPAGNRPFQWTSLWD